MSGKKSHNELLPHLFRQEYSKMTAVLCRHFGIQHIETAEDIASDTFLKASEHWAVHGIPANPSAWLYTVAKNKAKDYFRRLSVFENRVRNQFATGDEGYEFEFETDDDLIQDSQLAMIFAVCNPVNPDESQICLALQVLCGFSVEEIANALLTRSETIKKRLQRARNHLRSEHIRIIGHVSEEELRSRSDTVLKTLYLLFNEGYYSKTHSRQIRAELCSEAVRLALLLTGNPLTNTARANALLALMCFQSSRLEARTGAHHETVLFEDQDKELWDKSLIQRGNYYLVNATNGNEISKYHLEAAIAYWHTVPEADNRWRQILMLYDQLILIENSPVTALNRIFSVARVYGNQKAIAEADALNLRDNTLYHVLLGYLHADADSAKAIAHYEAAFNLTKSVIERQTLKGKIDRLKGAQ